MKKVKLLIDNSEEKRIFLKEKLSKLHYLAIIIAIAGIAVLGFADEM